MQLQCPLPRLDFDRITLGHGSGGLLTSQLLEAGVFNLLQNPLLDTHHDGAVFSLEGPLAFSTDSYVISPVFFPGGNIGELAINGTVNDLAMCGAVPRFLSLGFILEEGLLMTDFWEILLSIRRAADAAGVQVVTGDTKVVERGKGDGIFINTSGIGQLHPKARLGTAYVQPGDCLLVSGPIATHGVAVLSVRQGLEFETTLTSDTAPLNAPVLALLEALGPAVRLLRDPTRGGLATVLSEIADQPLHLGQRAGIALQQKQIPVLEEVAGACELLGLDPLYVANEGVFVAIVAPEAVETALSVLNLFDTTRQAACIGEVVADHAGQVVLTSRIGGRRVLSKLIGEQLPRIC